MHVPLCACMKVAYSFFFQFCFKVLWPHKMSWIAIFLFLSFKSNFTILKLLVSWRQNLPVKPARLGMAFCVCVEGGQQQGVWRSGSVSDSNVDAHTLYFFLSQLYCYIFPKNLLFNLFSNLLILFISFPFIFLVHLNVLSIQSAIYFKFLFFWYVSQMFVYFICFWKSHFSSCEPFLSVSLSVMFLSSALTFMISFLLIHLLCSSLLAFDLDTTIIFNLSASVYVAVCSLAKPPMGTLTPWRCGQPR